MITMPGTDTNGIIAALLDDLAAVQDSVQSRRGYKRAAATIFSLEEPIESLQRPDGSLTKIPNVGPKSEKIVLEVLKSGGSPSVEQSVTRSGKADDVAARRSRRTRFLSRAQVLLILDDDTLTGPTVEDYNGDFQMHSTWSDGSQTLEEIVDAGIERGYRISAVTDHSHGLRIARGVSMADIAKQHRDIDRVNAAFSGRFRLLKGVEANIAADGTMDLTTDELKQFELVVAAPHSALRSSADQTARMQAVVETPGVHILGHPRGRMYGSRDGVLADWVTVFAAAARSGVAIEIDGDPARQDIDYGLASAALEAGCLFALDSDAHSTNELRYSETAIAHARLAGIPTDRIVNCWSEDRLLAWLAARQNA
jgi:histidinol phosphatase-like PHP family hydrolase